MASRGRRRAVIAVLLVGALITAVSVVAQLATTDGTLTAVWVIVTVVGVVLILLGAVGLARLQRASSPPEDD